MRLGLSWTDAATVVISAVGIYLAFLVLIRIVGQRAPAAMSSFDFAATIALGAVMGRALLGSTPTLLAGLLGMATLFALQAGFGVLRRNRRLDRTLNNLPLLLMVNCTVLPGNLRKAKIVEDELREKLRLAASAATTSPPSSSSAPAPSVSCAKARPSPPNSSPTSAATNYSPLKTSDPDARRPVRAAIRRHRVTPPQTERASLIAAGSITLPHDPASAVVADRSSGSSA